MSVFISFDFEDRVAHELLCATLEAAQIAYWDPKKMEPGRSLRDQLRKAIASCDVCVFLATTRSIGSAWCAAEVGAFWGAGKRVIVFKSDPAVDPEKVPPQLRDDLWTAEILEVLRIVRQDIADANLQRRLDLARRPRLVSQMSIATLHDVLVSLRNTTDPRPLSETVKLIAEHVESDPADAEALLGPLVGQLLSVPTDLVLETAGRHWPTPFSLRTSTGDWLGFAKAPIQHPLIDGYTKCLLLLCPSRSCIGVAVVGSVVRRESRLECDGLIARAGETQLGDAQELKARTVP